MAERVRIEIEFERPGSHSLDDCIRLVMNQMREQPKWEDGAGTGLLNYVCYDRSMHIRSARLISEGEG